MDSGKEFEQEFTIFSANIYRAARYFYRERMLNQIVVEDPEIIEILNKNAHFWNDYNSMSTEIVFIILGRIFDKNKNAHSAKRLIQLGKKSLVFCKSELRKRKMENSTIAPEWVGDYIDNAYELREADWDDIQNYFVETEMSWKKLSPVRNKIFAHQERMTESKMSDILKTAQYDLIEEVLKRLLVLKSVFFEAFHNGIEPDFTIKNFSDKDRSAQEIKSLFSSMK